MTREQLILWNHLRATFDVTASAMLCFKGPIAGSEFLTYAATKLYFSLESSVNFTTAVLQNTPGLITLHDALNAAFFYLSDSYITWDSTAAAMRYSVNIIPIRNVYFSRMVVGQYSYMKFIGYRLTIA